MNEIMNKSGAELSNDLNTITAEIKAYQRVAGEAIFEIGRRLKHVKENDLAHGEFMEWYESIGLTKDFVSKAIRITDNLSNFETSRNIGLEALYQIATLPPEAREVEHELPNGTTKKPEDMTVRELRELKKALKQAEQQAELERKERERLEKENEELAKQADKPPRIEYVTPDDYEAVKQRLEEYRNRFGDLENYEEHITATHRQDMIVAVMSFSRGVREFIKRYEYIKRYKSVIDNLDEDSRQQYDEAVEALKGMADTFEFTIKSNYIIDAEYSEIN